MRRQASPVLRRVILCICVYSPPSFSMNLTSKHNCVCLDFRGMFTHFFHVPWVMSTLCISSRTPTVEMWGQGGHGTWRNAHPSRRLSFEPCSPHTYTWYTGSIFTPRAALAGRHGGRRPQEEHWVLVFSLRFPQKCGCCQWAVSHYRNLSPPPLGRPSP